ncbi:hypothetical protein RUM43_007720 [Polyplax serrata]|uniref:Uncharacterized protein n=1 Tax=Polyplax serrata TaxID=468196 RepID=A0AAN8PN67_POLSC
MRPRVCVLDRGGWYKKRGATEVVAYGTLYNQLGMVANVLMLKSIKIALSNTLWADFELSVDSVKADLKALTVGGCVALRTEGRLFLILSHMRTLKSNTAGQVTDMLDMLKTRDVEICAK